MNRSGLFHSESINVCGNRASYCTSRVHERRMPIFGCCVAVDGSTDRRFVLRAEVVADMANRSRNRGLHGPKASQNGLRLSTRAFRRETRMPAMATGAQRLRTCSEIGTRREATRTMGLRPRRDCASSSQNASITAGGAVLRRARRPIVRISKHVLRSAARRQGRRRGRRYRRRSATTDFRPPASRANSESAHSFRR